MPEVSPKLIIPFIVGTSQIVGQGPHPDPWLLYSTDDASEPDPTWTDVSDKLRSYSTSRGRESELADVDAGTMNLTLDDRDRLFDPTHNALIRPMNRWRLEERFSGLSHPVFTGYAEAYQEQWVVGAEEATTVVSAVDEFKVLALDKLPATDPPKPSYREAVLFDLPGAYWSMDDVDEVLTRESAAVGEDLVWINGSGTSTGAISGEEPGVSIVTTGTLYLESPPRALGASGQVTAGYAVDVSGLSEFALDFWFKWTTVPTATEVIVHGPPSGATWTWKLEMLTSGALFLSAKNSGGANHTVTSGALTASTWYHVVGTIESGSLRLYLNGVSVGSNSFSGAFGTLDPTARVTIGNGGTTIGAKSRWFDEVAVFKVGLTAARVTAHYEAGTARGFPSGVRPNARIEAVLDACGCLAPRNIGDSDNYLMTATYMVGQPPLQEIRRAESAEPVNAFFFVAKDGTLTYLGDSHRDDPPYDTEQATFDDDGTDFAYQDIGMDYSEAFLANEWNVTRTGAVTDTAIDANSIAKYGKRSQALTDVPITNNLAGVIANALITKYSEPFRRVTRLELFTADPDVIDNLLQRDLGDRIRVFRTPPGGGTRIDQQVFVQKISITGVPGQPRRIVLGLSPL